MRTTIALATLAATLACAMADERPAKPLLKEDNPVVALLHAADGDGDGVVAQAELDGAVGRTLSSADAEFDREWQRQLDVYGMPADTRSMELDAIFRATQRMFDAADLDRDGSLTPRELRDYAMSRPAPLRAGTITAVLAFDRNNDMTVSAKERAAAASDYEAEVKDMASKLATERDALLAPTRDMRRDSWRETTGKVCETARELWRKVARDGKAELATVMQEATPDVD